MKRKRTDRYLAYKKSHGGRPVKDQERRPVGQFHYLVACEASPRGDEFRAFRVVFYEAGRRLLLLKTCQAPQEAEAFVRQEIQDMAMIASHWQAVADRLARLIIKQDCVGLTKQEATEIGTLQRIAAKQAAMKTRRRA